MAVSILTGAFERSATSKSTLYRYKKVHLQCQSCCNEKPAIVESIGTVADVNEVVRGIIALSGSEATRYNVVIRTGLAADFPQVMADRVQLQQVLMNLMMNAIDAMKEVDGVRELTIDSRRSENEHLLISVSDTGVGLPQQQADQIFNAFVTTKSDGTGMGYLLAGPSLNRTAAACGLSITLRVEQFLLSRFP